MQKYEELLKKAIAAGKQRDYNESVRLLTKIITEFDDLPDAYLYLGRSYHALKDYNKAVIFLTYYRRKKPRSSAADFFLGRAYLAAGAFSRAVPFLKRASRYSSNIKPIILLGLAYLKTRNFEEAVHYLGQAVEQAPENRRLYTGYLNALLVYGLRRFNAEDLDTARQVLEFLETLDLGSVTVHLYLAKILREQGEHAKAVEYYRKASETEKDDELIRLQLADSLFACGRIDEARRIIQEIRHILPDGEGFSLGTENVEPLLAVKNFQNQDFRKALFHGCRALKSRRDADMHLLVGESYRNIGNLDLAENHFNQVLKGNPNSSEARMGLAMIAWQRSNWERVIQLLEGLTVSSGYDNIAGYYITLSRCRLEYPAEELLDQVREEVRRSGPDPHILSALAEQYRRIGYDDLAVKWYRKALLLNGNHTPAREGLLACYEKSENISELINLYREMLDREPENKGVRVKLVDALYTDKQYTDASKEAEILLGTSELDIRLQRLLAICYRKTKRYRDAAIIYRELLKEEPDNEVYLRSLLFSLDKCRRRKQAISLLEGALSYLKKPSSSLKLIHGVLLHKEGDTETAMAAFRSAMELDPRDWRPYHNIGKIYKDKGLSSFADKFLRKAEELKDL
ncbi:tetratricopeptide repeat protein [Marispirochaeta sp.]|jgi:tetratricopeptide (TPR) repeat protein|uniref:tetratricopeptide repeat protein n=1 Tax=Marispirochaeta sp. TaxID=2038653 RepID=UPI0029C6C4B1|nr:tetratricopeptide repeat protein [Marispirochaeta sp.]